MRAVISTLLLGGAVVAQITAPGSFPVDPFFFLIALTYALTIAFAVTLRFADRHRWLIDLQLAADALIVSAFIYLTGGVDQLLLDRCTCCRSWRRARCSSGAAACWWRR